MKVVLIYMAIKVPPKRSDDETVKYLHWGDRYRALYMMIKL